MQRILTNHIGYDSCFSKKAIFQSDKNPEVLGFCLVDEKTGEEVFNGSAVKAGAVAKWNKGEFWVLDFSGFSPDEKQYYSRFYNVIVKTGKEKIVSPPFEIYADVIAHSTLSSVVYYYKSQRPTGEWEAEDRNLGFRGPRQGRYDVRGGWFDASGDVGVHMTHMSHTSYFNPQQGSFTAYVLYRLLELLENNKNEGYYIFKRRLLDEASYGADWLMRMRAPSKAFFKNGPGRRYAYDPTDTMRAIGFEYKASSAQFGPAATADKETITDENYESSFRAGGGYAITALAAAARYPYPSCEHSGYQYLKAARDSYFYLEKNNEKYTNDGKWNLIDEFCALEALVELYKSSKEVGFLNRARDMAKRVMGKYVPIKDNSGYFSVAEGIDRPFFSAVDEGAPVVALLNYCGIETNIELKAAALDIAEKNMRFALDITNEVNNPFGYARIFYQEKDGKRGKQFFFPHNTEMAPWWQGDNARILSLSTAARYTAKLTADRDLAKRLNIYADDQIAWVLGLNPYDSCMVEGYGRHNIDYYFQNKYDFVPAPSGIVNGITGGIEDPAEGIEYVMNPGERPEISDNWRWAEQWLPHANWYIYALGMKQCQQ